VIAREGLPLLALAVLAAVVAGILMPLPYAVAGGMLVAVTIYLVREPRHRIPPSPLGIVSPARGKVQVTDTVTDPWLEREALRVRISMHPSGPFQLFSPTEGKVTEIWSGHKAQACNNSASQAVWLQTDEGDDVVVVISPRLMARRTRIGLNVGERVGQGHRIGFMFGGGCIDILMAVSSRTTVETGGEVVAGTDILAELVHAGNAAGNAERPQA